MNIWPPLFGAGIYIDSISDDFKQLTVKMKLRWYNRNYVKTQFGGSLYAMTDPFYMMMFIAVLGKEYIVWDKSASIRFIAPGKGTVTAKFVLTNEDIEKAKEATASGEKYLPEFTVDIVDDEGETIAQVEKQLYIRKKIKQ